MGKTVKKTISLPETLAREIEQMAREQGKTYSAVIQDAVRELRKKRLKKEMREIQNYWTRKAQERGILTEEDLEKYLSS